MAWALPLSSLLLLLCPCSTMASSSDPFYVEVQLAGDGVPAGAARAVPPRALQL